MTDEWKATPEQLKEWGVRPGEKPSEYRARWAEAERLTRRNDRIVAVFLWVTLGPLALMAAHLIFGLGNILNFLGISFGIYCFVSALGQAFRGE